MSEVTQIIKRAVSSVRSDVAKITTGFWSPAIMDCHRSKDEEKGRL